MFISYMGEAAAFSPIPVQQLLICKESLFGEQII